MSAAPRIAGLLETALYVEDMARSVRFFREVLGLVPMFEGDRLTAFDAGHGGVLLVFARGDSRAAAETPGGVIPGMTARDRSTWRSRSTPKTMHRGAHD